MQLALRRMQVAESVSYIPLTYQIIKSVYTACHLCPPKAGAFSQQDFQIELNFLLFLLQSFQAAFVT